MNDTVLQAHPENNTAAKELNYRVVSNVLDIYSPERDKTMNTETENLLVAARQVVCDFEEWGEVLQLADNDDDGMYGPDSAIMQLAVAVKAMVAEQDNNDMLNRYFDYLKSRIEVGDKTPLTFGQFTESMEAEMNGESEPGIKNEIRILREFVEEFSPIHQGQINDLSYSQLFEIVAEIVTEHNGD